MVLPYCWGTCQYQNFIILYAANDVFNSDRITYSIYNFCVNNSKSKMVGRPMLRWRCQKNLFSRIDIFGNNRNNKKSFAHRLINVSLKQVDWALRLTCKKSACGWWSVWTVRVSPGPGPRRPAGSKARGTAGWDCRPVSRPPSSVRVFMYSTGPPGAGPPHCNTTTGHG